MGLASDAAVANVALLRVGQRQLLDSLDEATTEAQACKAVFALARDSILEAFWWPFATRRQVLALTASTRSDWAYVYALPSDCVKARYVWPGGRALSPDSRIPFVTEASDDASSRVLLTDLAEAELVYTASITTPALWSAAFTEAVVWRLALDLTLALTVKPQFAANAATMAERSLAVAKVACSNESHPDVQPEAEAIRARE